MQRREYGQKLATALFETEDAIDAALEKAAHLIAAMSSVRRENGLSAVLGSHAMTGVTGAVRALGEARDQIVSAHHALQTAAPLVGLGNVVMQGVGAGKPEEDSPRPTGLKVAA
ncbi:hypothetical protein [Brevundimonas sp.]|uniref:hypothetical protein n=1 Tax=Brevundimonas sp. TaxID=1871086 RepID=UPI00260DBF81|nr:hypothetical protein [Brevundimonas sp.]